MIIQVKVLGVGSINLENKISLLDLSKKLYKDHKRYLGARINNQIYNLSTYVENGMEVEFLDNRDVDGYRIYTKTISAIFIMACKELYPEAKVSIEHFLGPGLYVKLNKPFSIRFTKLKEIEKKMWEIIREDYEIKRDVYSKNEAINIFGEYGYLDKIRLFNSIDKETVSIYKINNHIDSFHGYLAPSTGYIDKFKLKYYYPGALIMFPSRKNNYDLNNFLEQKKLAQVFEESSRWLNILDLSNLGSLNEKIHSGEINEVIKVSEALHEKKISQIADEFCANNDNNIILIAGPSSSGKTTFAQRLAIQLKVNGKKPIAISLDDYFVNREDTPLNPDGSYDFEALEAVDLELLNMDLLKLIEGQSIELPKFNFLTGKREKSGKVIKVDDNHPIIIEGIHGLNPKLTYEIPEKHKFKIYISALTQLNLDSHNRIATTDTRLIRRMVRDVKYRGNDPLRTFELWSGVRAGEERNIFPYQEEADVMFNSSLVYEMSVLKKYIVPLLQEIDNSSIYYSEAKKLLRFLEYFVDITDESVIPTNSILREFIGGASFNVH
ncbi:MAG: nucleoside kinase [Tissierellaceae bacterium]|nr:nucleoside kinase [Tissierellaceae bacterium]